ncbi:MAG: formylmethanofuran dehydrogenase subunit C [Phyllobacterium sp.]
MKALTFSLLAEPPERLDLSGLTPALLAGLTKLQIARLTIGSGRHPASVGDVFKVSGTDPGNIVFAGGSSRFDGVGARMQGGTIRVDGDAGRQAGRKMSGGSLLIQGNAGDHAGSGMAYGRLEIGGRAGDFLGGPLAGELAGMAGGLLIVRGKAGDYAGDRLRRGIIAILKGCGAYAGCRMLAGTLVVAGRTGAMPGYLMKRGSLLFDRRPEHLSPTFVQCGEPDIAFSGLFDRFLLQEKILDRPLLGDRPGRYGGDNAVLGKGEILFRRRAG